MLQRFVYGLCLLALGAFALKDFWQTSSISPYVLVGAPYAHEKSLNGKGVIVAVLDEGFDASHTFLKEKFSPYHRYTTQNTKSHDIAESLIFENGKYNFDSHGTHVSGIISTLAPRVEIIPIKIEGFGGDQTFVKALQLASNSPAHIVNISMRLSYTGREISPNVRQALFQLAQTGKLIVIAAGNESAPLMQHAYTASLSQLSQHPLMKKRLLLVGASSYKNGTESLAEFSNFPGTTLDQTFFITAPGAHVTSSITGGLFAEKSGTSMAAPMVVGAACLLKQAYPHLPPEDLNQLLLQSARKVALDGKALPYTEFGAGILNLKSALD